MSTITPTQPISSPIGRSAPPLADVYRMDIDEFERGADLLNAERVELIDGFIVDRSRTPFDSARSRWHDDFGPYTRWPAVDPAGP